MFLQIFPSCDRLSIGDFMKKQLLGSFYLILATIIWGCAFIAQRVGMDHIGPFTFQAVRCALAVVCLLPAIAIADKGKKDHKTFLSRWADKQLWLAGILCGIPLFLACNLQQLGLTDTDAGKSAFLTAMYIIFVPIIGIFQKKKPSPILLLSVALSAIGLYCLCGIGVTSILRSDLLLLGCALMFAVQIIFVDKFAPSVDTLRLNLIQALICAILSAVVMFLTETPTWSAIGDCWLPLAYAGFLSMGAAYAFQIAGQKRISPTGASVLMSLESVFAVLFGWLLLKETLTCWEGLGCVLMFIAVILSNIPSKKAGSN